LIIGPGSNEVCVETAADGKEKKNIVGKNIFSIMAQKNGGDCARCLSDSLNSPRHHKLQPDLNSSEFKSNRNLGRNFIQKILKSRF
jgi:hypothetical protein